MHGTFDRIDEAGGAGELDAISIVTAARKGPRKQAVRRIDGALVAGLALLVGLAAIVGMGLVGFG